MFSFANTSSGAWVLLLAAGLLEIVWAVGLKSIDGWRRPLPLVVVAAAFVASLALLARALRTIPLGTGYAVWVGIGIFGTAAAGIVVHGEPASVSRLFFLGMLLVAIAGLKLTT